ncbi:acyloxyacyl hydrolase [Flavobacterium sp. RHBU_24]|uniref:acyloxyacyl hydrolase n=1 Tax=Flavobacterium sp. RHBU_24 TaxID=3391185 RepID=UPI0039847B69
MKHKLSINGVLLLLLVCINAQAQYAVEDTWYNNPLGFEPVKLHTSMGFLLPAVAVGTCLLLTKKDTTLARRISFYNETGMSWGYKYPGTFLPQNNTGINFELRKWMSVGIEFDIVVPRDNYNNTTGFALRPFARFYMINRQKARLYFESGGGFIWLAEEFPQPTENDARLGTKFNGITKYGIGSEINVTKSTALLFGIRHIHISNGNSKGVERNPSHDSNGFFIGISHKL